MCVVPPTSAYFAVLRNGMCCILGPGWLVRTGLVTLTCFWHIHRQPARTTAAFTCVHSTNTWSLVQPPPCNLVGQPFQPVCHQCSDSTSVPSVRILGPRDISQTLLPDTLNTLSMHGMMDTCMHSTCWYNGQGRMNTSTRAKIHCNDQKQGMLQSRSTITMQEHSHFSMLCTSLHIWHLSTHQTSCPAALADKLAQPQYTAPWQRTRATLSSR